MTPRSLITAATSIVAILLAVSYGGCGLDASGRLEAPPGSPCVNSAQCSKSANPCNITRCGETGVCETDPAPNGEAPAQTAADCQRNLCEGGQLKVEPDDEDILDDREDCTIDTCVEGSPRNTARQVGAACNVGEAAGSCGPSGQCAVECSPEQPACDDGQPCTTDTCDVAASVCLFTPIDGTPPPDSTQTDGDCQVLICLDGVDVTTPDDTDVPPDVASDCKERLCAGGVPMEIPDNLDILDDGNLCTTDTCVAGVAMNTPVAPGSSCEDLFCDAAGQCVGCFEAANCGTSDECRTRTCVNGVCGVIDTAAMTPLSDTFQTDFDCKQLVCNGVGSSVTQADPDDLPVDANPCTSDQCSGTTPVFPPEPELTMCGNGVCNGAGVCLDCITDMECMGFDTCGGAGTPNQCGCAQTTCAAEGNKNCGLIPDACGGMLNCGSCIGFDTCGGAGTPNVCGCVVTEDTCMVQNKNCGVIIGQCGLVGCGACTAPESCGGSGVMNVCGCTPNNPCIGKDCGMAVDICGNMVMCGPNTCPAGQTCGGSSGGGGAGGGGGGGGGGEPNVCG